MTWFAALFSLHDLYHDADRGHWKARKSIRRRKQLISTPRLRVEPLEERNLLSTHYPLDPVQWTALGPAPVVASGNLSTGRIAAVAAHPTDANTIYVATAGGGVWKTVDGGVNWRPLTDMQATLFMGAIALAPSNPDIIYAGTGEANYGPSKLALVRENVYSGRGILKSTDAGATWALLGSGLFYRRTISRIVIDPHDANTVYVAVGALAVNGLPGDTGIWKSTDGGATWNQMIHGIASFSDNDAVSDLAMDPSNSQHLFAAVGTPGGSGANGIYQTFDSGATWSVVGNFPTGAMDPALGRISLAIAPSSPQTMFAVAARAGSNATLLRMVKSTDAGVTWTTVTTLPSYYMGPYGDYNNSLAIDPSNPNTVYAGGEQYIERSLDGGLTWSNIEMGSNAPHDDHHAIAFDAAGRYLDGGDGGIWRLDNASPARWHDLNGTLNTIQFMGIALDPTNADIAYGGSQDNFTEKFTDNYAWNALLGGDGGFTRVDFASPSTVYMTYQYSVGSIFLVRSDQAGNNSATKTTGINTSDPGNFYVPYLIDPANSNRLLLGTNRVYETLNRADRWTPISKPFVGGWTVDNVIDSVAAAASDSDTIYAAAGGHVFVTHDHGASWMESNPTVPRPDLRFTDIYVDSYNASLAYVVAANYSDVTGGGHVWVTTDGGGTWTDISGNLPDEPVWSIAVLRGQDILYVGAEDGVYISSDGGMAWDRAGQGLPHVQVRQLELNMGLGILAAATHGRGLWELEIQAQAPLPNRQNMDQFGGRGGEVVAWWRGDAPRVHTQPCGPATWPPSSFSTSPVPGLWETGTALEGASLQHYLVGTREEHGRGMFSGHGYQMLLLADFAWSDVLATGWSLVGMTPSAPPTA
jgi:photosystem II stability/assembly factor-like uncharacterized protein